MAELVDDMNKYAPTLFSLEPPTPGFMPKRDEVDLERIHRLGTLAAAINDCVVVWKDKSIELANLLKSAREEFLHDKATPKAGKAWRAWVKREVNLGESRVRDLLQIAYSDDPEEAVLRLREKGKARSQKFRRRQSVYSGRKSHRVSDIIERERFIDWVYSAHPDEVKVMWAETQKRYPVPAKTDELYEIDMHAYVLGTGKLDILSVARGLRIDRNKAVQLLDYATRMDWIVGLPNNRWDRHDVPYKPTTLLEFLVKHGGIKDDRGELEVRDLGNIRVRTFGSLLNNKSGLTLDDARRMAVDAGYLHDPGELTGRPSDSMIGDLLDAIEAEIREKFCFSTKDAQEAECPSSDNLRLWAS